jgi:hypothetical protein
VQTVSGSMIWRLSGVVPMADPREDLFSSAEADAIQKAFRVFRPKMRSE